MPGRELQNAGVEPLGVVEQTPAVQSHAGFYRLIDRALFGLGNRSALRAVCG
jgi:hypothetical protein